MEAAIAESVAKHLEVTIAETRYTWIRVDLGQPLSKEWAHPGAASLADGRFVVPTPSGTQLAIIGRDGAIGTPLSKVISVTAMHGMLVDPRDPSRIWVSDNGHKFQPQNGANYSDHAAPGRVVCVNLNGDILDDLSPAELPSAHQDWRPCGVAIDEATGRMWVADGYGHHLVHCFSAEGAYLSTIDGSASGRLFDTPHGIVIDQRSDIPLLLIADRGNKRIVAFTLGGTFVRSIGDGMVTSPSGLAIHNENLWVTELFGALVVFDADDQIVTYLGTNSEPSAPGWPNEIRHGQVVAPEIEDRRLRSPHGIAINHLGQVLIAEWLIGGRTSLLNPVLIEY